MPAHRDGVVELQIGLTGSRIESVVILLPVGDGGVWAADDGLVVDRHSNGCLIGMSEIDAETRPRAGYGIRLCGRLDLHLDRGLLQCLAQVQQAPAVCIIRLTDADRRCGAAQYVLHLGGRYAVRDKECRRGRDVRGCERSAAYELGDVVPVLIRIRVADRQRADAPGLTAGRVHRRLLIVTGIARIRGAIVPVLTESCEISVVGSADDILTGSHEVECRSALRERTNQVTRVGAADTDDFLKRRGIARGEIAVFPVIARSGDNDDAAGYRTLHLSYQDRRPRLVAAEAHIHDVDPQGLARLR